MLLDSLFNCPDQKSVLNLSTYTLVPSMLLAPLIILSDKAHAMLLSTLAWRAENQPWQLENKSSRTDKTCSDERIIGYDLKGRIVVYSSFANTYKRTPKDVQVGDHA